MRQNKNIFTTEPEQSVYCLGTMSSIDTIPSHA